MHKFHFYKYQGTGNDFIMIDDREEAFPYQHVYHDKFNITVIEKLCNRRFGVGADGVILIRNHRDYDFEMIYFNADGSQSLCGNGSRCAVVFASKLGIISNNTTFMAIDGAHEAIIEDELVHLRMGDVNEITHHGDQVFIDTGSPHYVKWVAEVENYKVFEEGYSIRHQPEFLPGGTNVNFIEKRGVNEIYVRTFERGVENETLSCGTGVTAASLAAGLKGFTSPVNIKTRGGKLSVAFKQVNQQNFQEIYLIGPAGMVFEGEVEI